MARKTELQLLPRFGESWSFRYVEKAAVERGDNAPRFADTTNRALRDYDGVQLVVKEGAREEPEDG